MVLGSNNSAHDICAALWEHGADVTMVQRTSTHIAPSNSLMELALGGLYSEQAVKAGVTTNMADLIFASIPYKIMARASASNCGCASAPRLAGATSWPERDGQTYSE